MLHLDAVRDRSALGSDQIFCCRSEVILYRRLGDDEPAVALVFGNFIPSVDDERYIALAKLLIELSALPVCQTVV